VFLQGFLGKSGCRTWCFDGAVVVECVVKMVRWQSLFEAPKLGHGFEIYFEWVLFWEWSVLWRDTAGRFVAFK
jgi:hypothetical protein